MPKKPRASQAKHNKAVVRNVSKQPRLQNRVLPLVFVVVFGLIGSYFLWRSFALSATAVYSGQLGKKNPVATYTVAASANGTLTADASYTKLRSLEVDVLDKTGIVIASSAGNSPVHVSTNVTSGNYTIRLSGSGTGNYSLKLTYPIADSVAPTLAISSPGNGATVSGSVPVLGSASDNDMVSAVAVKVDGGSWQTASGTTSWSYNLDTTTLPNGAHTITAQATDASGNTTSQSVNVTVANQTATADTTPPVISIANPTYGATVSGNLSVSGSASDNSAVASVQVAIDNGSWQTASGAGSWSYAWNTTSVSNGNHTLAARATDTSGNVTVVSEPVSVSNQTASNCLSGSPILQQAVTTEGVTIRICTTTGGWTPDKVNALLKPNARDLTTVGPHLTMELQANFASTESTTAVCCTQSGGYYNYQAVVYLNPSSNQAFSVSPDAIMAHEYGHAWTNYWVYMNPANNGSWNNYLSARGILNDSRVNSTYNWSPREMAADDYRRLFGTTAAQTELNYINPDVPDSQQVPGLSSFFLNQFAIP